jgi:hypothetical protein
VDVLGRGVVCNVYGHVIKLCLVDVGDRRCIPIKSVSIYRREGVRGEEEGERTKTASLQVN